jgi:hypothetical protein
MYILRDKKGTAVGWNYDVELAAKPGVIKDVDDSRLAATLSFQRSYTRRL